KLSLVTAPKNFKAVLQTFESGVQVLAALREAREFITQEHLTAEGAFIYLVRQFGLPGNDPVINAMVRFAAAWKAKPFVKDGSLAAFLQYLDFFQQGKGIVPLFTEEQMAELERRYPDAVQLMTVHAAKGLEFSHVWLLRVTSGSFPTYFKEGLFEFPPALR